jgi:D-alanyl-D-alanine carboxypeptidase
MTRCRSVLICAVIACAALTPGAAFAHTPRARSTSAGLGGELRGLVQMPDGLPGAIVVVQRGAHRHVYTAGVRKLGSQLPVRASDRMRLASTAKAFSGAVALSLVAATSCRSATRLRSCCRGCRRRGAR